MVARGAGSGVGAEVLRLLYCWLVDVLTEGTVGNGIVARGSGIGTGAEVLRLLLDVKIDKSIRFCSWDFWLGTECRE